MRILRSIGCAYVSGLAFFKAVGVYPQSILPVGYEWLWIVSAFGWLFIALAGDQ